MAGNVTVAERARFQRVDKTQKRVEKLPVASARETGGGICRLVQIRMGEKTQPVTLPTPKTPALAGSDLKSSSLSFPKV